MKALKIFALTAMLMLLALPVHAALFTFEDTVIYWPTWTSTETSDNTSDVVGVPNITGGSLTTNDSGYLTSVEINWQDGGHDLIRYPTDIFIDMGSDGDWDYVIKHQPTDGYFPANSYGLTPTTTGANFNNNIYSFEDGEFLTTRGANDSYYIQAREGTGTGSDIYWGSFDIRNDHPVYFNAASGIGTVIGSVDTVTGLFNQSSGTVTYADILYSSSGGIYLGFGEQDFTIGYAPLCANDAIFSPAAAATPEPGTFLLMGAGFLGLLGFSRRFKLGMVPVKRI